eukprot:scaffold647_cov150-Skeletonema_menzelii.AAC.24
MGSDSESWKASWGLGTNNADAGWMTTYLYCYSLHTKLLSTECARGGRCAVGAGPSRVAGRARGATDGRRTTERRTEDLLDLSVMV